MGQWGICWLIIGWIFGVVIWDALWLIMGWLVWLVLGVIIGGAAGYVGYYSLNNHWLIIGWWFWLAVGVAIG